MREFCNIILFFRHISSLYQGRQVRSTNIGYNPYKVPAMAFIEVFYRKTAMMSRDAHEQGVAQKAFENGTREELLEELRAIGIATGPFEQFTIEQLENLADRVRLLNSSKSLAEGRNSPAANRGSRGPILTEVDKKMLQTLLTSS